MPTSRSCGPPRRAERSGARAAVLSTCLSSDCRVDPYQFLAPRSILLARHASRPGLHAPRRSASVARVYAAGERADDAVLLAPPEPLTLEALGRIAAGAPGRLRGGVPSRPG